MKATEGELLQLVRRIAASVHRKVSFAVALEELEQEGWFGLQEAKRGWRPDGGASLKTYAGPRIRGHLLDYLREIDHLSRSHRNAIKRGDLPEVRIDSLDRRRRPAGDDNRERSVGDDLGQPHVDFAAVERRDFVETLLAGLRPRSRELMRLYYLQGLNMKEVGRRLRVSESRVSQLHSAILRALRLRLKVRGEMADTEVRTKQRKTKPPATRRRKAA